MEFRQTLVPELTKLHCAENQLTVLDVRRLSHLGILSYDKQTTQLLQRPTQRF